MANTMVEILALYLNLLPDNRSRFNPHCEFFDFSNTSNQSGSFSTDGITQLRTTNSTFVQCRSEHLTSFAVLVDATGDTTGSKALSIVSYIGCGISIVCLLFTIIVLIVLRKQVFNQVHHFVHLNLSIALLLGLLTFVSGIETVSEYRASCLTVAILLHYFFMAAFSWMLCEGILLFVMLNFVFYKGLFKSKKFFMIFGWGLPIPIVAVSAAVSHEQYGINDRCWLSEEKGAIWAFIGPMLLIILVNLFFLSTILYEVFRSKHSSVSAAEITTLETVKSLIKAAIIVTPLLGITWVFGLLAINESTVAFAWIFTILNSLQGLFIMFFYVLRNEAFLKKIKLHKRGDSRTYSTITKGSTLKSTKGTLRENIDENTRAKILTRYNTVICNDYTTPASVVSPNTKPPSTIFNTPGIVDDYDFDEMDEIHYTSPRQHHLMRSTSPPISPSQYLQHQREAVFIQANEDDVKGSSTNETLPENMDENTRAKILTHYNTVICNDYTTPASVVSPNTKPPNTIFNTPGIVDDYDFDDMDKIYYTSPRQHHLMRSTSPPISPSQYLMHQREAVFMQANEDDVEDTNL